MRIQHILLALLVVVVWGFNFVVIEIGLQDISPLMLCIARFFLASIPAVFFIKRPAIPFKMVILYGSIMFALQFALLFIGMKIGITAGLASLLLQTQVFFTILFAVLFLKEIPNKWQLIGALLAFIGIGIIAMHFGEDINLTGFLLVIAAAAAWGTANIISKKIGKVNMLSLIVWSSFVAWPILIVVTLLTQGVSGITDSIHSLSWLTVSAVLFIVYLSTLFGYTVWCWLLSHYPVTTVAPFTLLVPIFGMLSSTLILGEPLQIWKILAVLLVVAGLCINVFAPRLFLYIKHSKLN